MKTATTLVLALFLTISTLTLANEPASPIAQTPPISVAEPALPPANPALIGEVSTSALAGDWKRVLDLTEGVGLNNPSPVLKLVRGHACLALNLNNEATLLFFGTRDPQELHAYQVWAGENLARNPEHPYARFFVGDAAARLGELDEAVREFDTAIRMNGDFALPYNARGVVQAAQDQIESAKQDFRKALALTENRLADASSNMGYLWIQSKRAKEGAKEAFTKAIEASPGFALAQHGRGCIALIQQQPTEAATDLAAGDENGAMFVGLMVENELRYAAKGSGVAAEDLIAELQEPGMSLRMSEMTRSSMDKLRHGAEADFAMADRLESMKFLPFNQHFARAAEGAGVGKLRRLQTEYGSSAIDGVKGMERGISYAKRWTANDAKGASLDGQIRQTQTKFVTDIGINFGEKMLGSGNARVAIAGAIAKSYKDNIDPHFQALARTWNEYDRTTMGTLAQRPSERMPTAAETRSAVQGVDLTIKIDNGDWPFVPIYSLAYPLPGREPK